MSSLIIPTEILDEILELLSLDDRNTVLISFPNNIPGIKLSRWWRESLKYYINIEEISRYSEVCNNPTVIDWQELYMAFWRGWNIKFNDFKLEYKVIDWMHGIPFYDFITDGYLFKHTPLIYK